MNTEEKPEDVAAMRDDASLVIQRWLPGPVERIWRYQTEAELRRKWLASGDMELAPGAAMELVWRNDDLSDPGDARPDGFPEEQRMPSQVIAVDPMRCLTIAWGKGEVSFELTETGDKALLTLTHRGLDDPSARNMIAAGWHEHLSILAATISGIRAVSFWSAWADLRDDYETRFSGRPRRVLDDRAIPTRPRRILRPSKEKPRRDGRGSP